MHLLVFGLTLEGRSIDPVMSIGQRHAGFIVNVLLWMSNVE